MFSSDTREAAFTYALTSAGVVWALARACANNNLSQYCKCSKESKPSTLKNEYLWSGCGDNINYGLNLTKLFVDAEEYDNMRYTDPSDTVSKKRVVMNMHNNNLGRTVSLYFILYSEYYIENGHNLRWGRGWVTFCFKFTKCHNPSHKNDFHDPFFWGFMSF